MMYNLLIILFFMISRTRTLRQRSSTGHVISPKKTLSQLFVEIDSMVRQNSTRRTLRPRSNGHVIPTNKTVGQQFAETESYIQSKSIGLSRKRKRSISPIAKSSSESRKRFKSANEMIKVPERVDGEYTFEENIQRFNTCDELYPPISATNISDFLMDDPILSYFKMLRRKDETRLYNEVFSDIITKREFKENEDSELFELAKRFRKGDQFEEIIVNKLKKAFPDKHIDLTDNRVRFFKQNNWNCAFEKTKKAIFDGIPIIFQAVLVNPDNNTRGVADILVRADYLNKIVFDNEYNNPANLTDSEQKIKVKGTIHPVYYVIDIKWSTLDLAANSPNLWNSHRMPANKGQVLVYNIALGKVQGYTPTKSYILGRTYKRTKSRVTTVNYSPFSYLGIVDFDIYDKSYFDRVIKAMADYRTMANNFRNYKLFDGRNNQPNTPFLKPNMNNHYDQPWHYIKKKVALKQRNLTIIPFVSKHQSETGESNGYVAYDQEGIRSEHLGIKSDSYRGKIVNSNFKVNRKNVRFEIAPQKLTDNTFGWQTYVPYEFFIDFEMTNVDLDPDVSPLLDNEARKENSSYTFLIGVYHVHKGEQIYKPFILESRTREDQIKLYSDVYNYVTEQATKIRKYHSITNDYNPRVYCWGNAEISEMKRQLNHKQFNFMVTKLDWIDYNKVLMKEGFAVTKAFGTSLKKIVPVLHEHGCIESTYEGESITSGMGACVVGNTYYKVKENKEKYDQNSLNAVENQMKEVIKYNKVDCKVIHEILTYIRANHI